MLSSDAIMCRLCYDALYHHGLEPTHDSLMDFSLRSATCSCQNLAIIWDEDVTPRIYVHDISSAQMCKIFHLEDYKEIRRVLGNVLTSALFVDITHMKQQPLTYQPHAPKNKYQRVTSTKYNNTLIKALDRYKHETSDGNEEFLRTTHNDPLKGV